MDDERRKPFHFGLRGHRSSSTLPPCEGMPRFALSSWILITSFMYSHTFDLARNVRGLIGDRHVVDKRAAANRCGDLSVGTQKKSYCMFTNTIMYFKYPRIKFLPLFSFMHSTCTIKLHLKAVSSILTKLLKGITKIAFLARDSCFTKNNKHLWGNKTIYQ